ncbi:recombinase zinc beta ribbon domain-containing protein [Clostridium sp. WILCCON 0269]|uniref:Recombinase zinc beta ribbon domain-containing protein n=1 Tax=Candidatus Clostridium eludens TaxID=3381663 RepID=A0ABW8SQV2_9CLOT
MERVKENGKEVSYLKKEKEADNIKEIFKKYASGYTAFEIHQYFKLKGLKYNPKTIYGILTNPTYLTGGIMKCKCGSGMGVSPGRQRSDGTRRYYFICSGKRYRQNGCDNLSLRVDQVESKINAFLESMRDKEKLVEYHNKKQIVIYKRYVTYFCITIEPWGNTFTLEFCFILSSRSRRYDFCNLKHIIYNLPILWKWTT